MDAFSYIIAFLGLIPALALANVLGGLTELLHRHLDPDRGRIVWSPLFLGWATILTFSIAFDWWLTYAWSKETSFDFWFFCFLLIKASVYLFLSRLLMPSLERDAEVRLYEHFQRVRPWFFTIAALGGATEIFDTYLHGSKLLESAPYWIFMSIWMTAIVIAAFVSNRGYQWAVLVAYSSVSVLSAALFGTGRIGS